MRRMDCAAGTGPLADTQSSSLMAQEQTLATGVILGIYAQQKLRCR
jgi:hypothetical protein